MSKWFSEKRASMLAEILKGICILMTFLALLTTVMVLMGRMQIHLYTPETFYNDALLLEKNHEATSRFMFVNLSHLEVHLHTANSGGKIDIVTYLCTVLMGVATVVPMGYAFFKMSRFFGNIAKGSVFSASNASLLLNGGLVLLAGSLLAPLLSLLVLSPIANKLTSNVISISASFNLTALFAGAILLVMAYVFHYGIYLQDEADHTL